MARVGIISIFKQTNRDIKLRQDRESSLSSGMTDKPPSLVPSHQAGSCLSISRIISCVRWTASSFSSNSARSRRNSSLSSCRSSSFICSKPLYETLLDLKAYKQLLSLDNPRLEKHLKIESGLPSEGADRGIGPLDPSQVFILFHPWLCTVWCVFKGANIQEVTP